MPLHPLRHPQRGDAALQDALFETYWKKKKSAAYRPIMPLPHRDETASKLNTAVVLEEPLESISARDFDALSDCPHCRYPCHLSGVPSCSPCDYLRQWRAEAHLKPLGLDTAQSMRLPGGMDVAVVSAGGRLQTWKTDNQDTFFLQPLSLPGGSKASAAELSVPALAIGVFDGHGRLGHLAARDVRNVVRDSLVAGQLEREAAAAEGATAASHSPSPQVTSPQALLATLLQSAFTKAAGAMAASRHDYTKSGTTAVVCGVTPDGVTAVWTGDSRAVLGICSSGHACTIALPLTDDHKPGRPDERSRIVGAGGRVDRSATDHNGNAIGPFRVFLPNSWIPGLALSRAFGDFMVSGVGIVHYPDVTTLQFKAAAAAAASTTAALSTSAAAADGCSGPNGVNSVAIATLVPADAAEEEPSFSAAAAAEAAAVSAELASSLGTGSWDDPVAPGGGRHVLIVASDGLWEWLPNAAAVRIASSFERAEDAAHALVEAAQKHWAIRYAGRNCDDITVAVAFLPADPSPLVTP